MENWKKIYQIDEFKEIISVSNNEIMESLMRSHIQTSLAQKLDKVNTNDNFYFGSDGFWHIYNPITKQWYKQSHVYIFLTE